jgi:hypothetical protein
VQQRLQSSRARVAAAKNFFWRKFFPLEFLYLCDRAHAMAASTPRFCIVCNRPAKHVCSHCRIEPYCSRACQRCDWSTHQPVCSAPIAGHEAITTNTRRFRTAMSAYANLMDCVFTLAFMCAERDAVLAVHEIERRGDSLVLRLAPLIATIEWHAQAVRALLDKLEHFPFYIAAAINMGEPTAMVPLQLTGKKFFTRDGLAVPDSLLPVLDRVHYEASAKAIRHAVTCERHRATALLCPCHPIALTVQCSTGRVSILSDFSRPCSDERMVALLRTDTATTDSATCAPRSTTVGGVDH